MQLELQLAQVSLYKKKNSNYQELGLYMNNNF